MALGRAVVTRPGRPHRGRRRRRRVRVVDLKTGASKPTVDEVRRHGQLGAYQLAVEEGAFAEHGHRSGGAALLQLGTGRRRRRARASSRSRRSTTDDEPDLGARPRRRGRRGHGGAGLRGDARARSAAPARSRTPARPAARGEAAVTATTHPARCPRRGAGPALGGGRLARALGQPHAPTPEQAAVIEAPLRPLLVVAGAGSGKTETMAARVVWLVANGLVRPTRCSASPSPARPRASWPSGIGSRLRRLRDAGIWTPPGDDGTGAEVLDDVPTVSTYHAYAGRLVARARAAGRARAGVPAAHRGRGLAVRRTRRSRVGRPDGRRRREAESTRHDAVVARRRDGRAPASTPAASPAHLDDVVAA